MSKGFCVVPENPLYKQIHKIVADHEKANLIYALTQSKEFQNTFGSSLIYDSKGYPTLESIMSLFNDDMIQQSDVFRKSLETDLNTNMPTRNVDVVRRAVEFNKKATPYYAKIVDINGQQSQIQLVKRNNDTSEIETLENNLKMFDTIDNLLKKLGIDIKILDPSYFHGEDALMIPSNLNKQANGILGVINLANNYAGFKALPEEFGHFLIECCKSNPIIGRCEAYLADNLELCQSILGTEFQSVQNYYNQKNRPDLFFREVLGRIVAQYLNSGEVDSNTLLSRGETAVQRFIEKTFKITNQDQKDTFDLFLGFFNTVNEFVDLINKSNYYTPEMQMIKANAIRAGTFMKAPNGNPTNLNERQWLQVRTKAFKDWFGDWENDPENASKVVDENGEPLIVYHGSKDNSFVIFDRTKNDKGQKGFFFTNSEVMASSYGRNPRAFFLNAKDPYTIEGNGHNWNDISITTSTISKNKLDSIRLYKNQLQLQVQNGTISKDVYDFWNNKYFKQLDYYNSLGNSIIDKIKKRIILRQLEKFKAEGNFVKSTRYTENILELDTDDVSMIFNNITDYGPVFNAKAAYGSIYNIPANVYVVTNPNNIKSATGNIGIFDSINDNIYNDNGETQRITEILNAFTNDGDTLAHTQEDFTTHVDAIMDKLSRNASKYVAVYRKQNKELTDVINSVFWGGLKQLDPETQQQQLNALYSAYIKNPNSAHTNVLMQLIRYKTIISSSNILFSEQVTKLKTLKQDLEQKGYTIESILQNAHKIQQLKNLILVYNDSIQEFLDELTNVEFLEDYNDEEKALLEGVKDDIYKLFTYIRKANSEVEDFSYKLIYNYYLSTFNPNGEDKIQLAGTSLNAETTISLTDVLHYTHGDISTMNRLLDTGYNSSDILTQLVSTKIKQQQEKIRLMTTADAQNLSTLLEKYGKDTQFMHEMTKDGKPTGYYVNKYGIDFAKFDEEKKNAFAAIDKRKHLSDDEKSILKAKWYQDNTRPITLTTYTLVNNVWSVNPNVTMTVKIPIKDSRWSSDAYDNLSTEQKELCDILLEYKHKLDYINGLTGNFRPFKCVQRTVSSLTEKVVNKDSSVLEILKNKLRFTDEDVEQYGNQINDELMSHNSSFFARIKTKINRIFNADAQEITDSVTQLSDFEGKLYRRVPLNYVKDLQDISQLSTNAFDSLLHYAAATYQHECMNEIVDIMELTKAQANKRRQKQYDSTGRKIRSKLGPGDDQYEGLTLPSAGSNINKQLENIINTQVYGEFKRKGTTILNDTISLSKLTDGILRLTSLSMLGYNPFTAINNVVVGKSQMLIQSIGSEHFTFSNWLQADKEYFSLLQEYLGELGKPFKTSKLALIEQTFNPHNEWWEQTVQKGIYKPNALRVFETVCGPSFMMQAGEHHMKMSTCLALMFGMKMIDTKNNNQETNLYDALESYTVPNSSGNGTHLELRIRDGVVKPDGKPFTLQSFNQIERSDLQQFTDLTTIINHRMHGVYDKEDYIEAKQYALGRIFLLFRNFMFPFFSRRWKGISTLKTNQQRYNIQLNTTDEGYYVTTMKFLKQMFFPNTQNLRNSGGFIARAQMLIDGLSTTEKQNFYKMFSETITTLITWLLLFGLFRDWDDHEGNWVARATNYFTRRLQAEMTYAWNPSTLLDILQSPTPVMGPLKDITRVLKSIGDDHILKTGPYKGQTRFVANVKRALPIIPNVIDFFKLDTEDKKFKVFEDTFWYKNSKEDSE